MENIYIYIYIHNGAGVWGDGKFWCDGFRWLRPWIVWKRFPWSNQIGRLTKSDFVSNGEFAPLKKHGIFFKQKNLPKRISHSFVGIFNFHFVLKDFFLHRFSFQIHSGCFFWWAVTPGIESTNRIHLAWSWRWTLKMFEPNTYDVPTENEHSMENPPFFSNRRYMEKLIHFGWNLAKLVILVFWGVT